jgi:hypothetical protein
MAPEKSPGARIPGLVWGSLLNLLVAGACTGTEHAVFEPLPSRPHSVDPPPAQPDGGDPPDARLPPIISASTDAGDAPDPGLDPTVVFEWKHSLPGQGTCRAGRYAGSFECTMQGPGIGEPAAMLSGAVSFTLTGSPEEPVLSISDGQISGAFFSSGMSGKLDCIGKQFSGMAVDGKALLGQGTQSPLPALFPRFDAELDGHFDDQALVIDGLFAMTNDSAQMCRGTFHASVTP